MENLENNLNIISNNDKLELYSDDYPYSLSLKINEFEDEKSYIKFIKNCEKIIRSSIEYSEWRKYLKDVLGQTTCVITSEISDELTIEIHHHIPSLHSIIKTILNKYLNEKIEFCSFDICIDVIKLHYLNKIGYVPLIKSMHEKFHSGYLKIPINLVRGNYKEFIEEYGKYIDDEDFEIIKEREAIINTNNKWSVNNYPGLINEDEINNIIDKVMKRDSPHLYNLIKNNEDKNSTFKNMVENF